MLPGENTSAGAAGGVAAGAAFALVAAIALTLCFTPLRASHDEFWHLKTGRYIDEHGLPENDIFSFAAEEIPWHNHEWLSQVALWRIWRWGEGAGLGGWRAVIGAKTIFLGAAFLGLAWALARRTGAPAMAAFSAAMALALSRRTLYPRPPFVTYGLLIVLVIFLLRWRDRRLPSPWLLAMAPFFALWANLHGGFMAGLVVAGAFWAEAAANVALARWRMEDPKPEIARLLWFSGALAMAVLATLATPYGYHLYLLPGRVMADRELLASIFEMQPADWNYVWALDAALAVMTLAAIRPRTARGLAGSIAAALGLVVLFRSAPGIFSGTPEGRAAWALWLREIFGILILLFAAGRSKEKVGLGLSLALLFFFHQAAQHQRHLPLFGILLAPAMACALADWARGSVGAWDWMVRKPDTKLWAEEAQAELRAARVRAAERFSLAALAIAAAFYLFWPGEAATMFRAGEPGFRLGDAMRAPSWLDRNLRLWRGTEMEPGSYPVAAADYLDQANPAGRLFTGGNYAGYLIWRFAPERYKVFTDNRYDIYGGKFVRDEWTVLEGFEGNAAAGAPGWREIAERWGIRILFIPAGAPIQKKLEAERAAGRGEWKEDYNDGAWSIWTRP